MGCDTYSVWLEKMCVGQGMSIGNAVIFLKALMEEYYNEPTLSIAIQREPPEAAEP